MRGEVCPVNRVAAKPIFITLSKSPTPLQCPPIILPQSHSDAETSKTQTPKPFGLTVKLEGLVAVLP